MRALLFVTIALSLSASASDDSRLQRKDIVPENAENDLGISNRDLAVFSTSNASDANSLNMISKRTVDQLQRPTKVEIIPLTISKGRFTTDITIDAHHISGLAFLDTGSGTTWVRKTNRRNALNDSPFKSMGFNEFHGGRASGVVTVNKVPAKEMEFRTVRDDVKTASDYAGGLALDRSSTSWLSHIDHDKIYPVISFYSTSQHHAEFHLGAIPPTLVHQMKWYKLKPKVNQWELDDARIKVHGLVEGVISTIMDTGTHYIYGSKTQVEKMYTKLKWHRHSDGSWITHCDDRKQPVTFSWGRTNFPIHDFLVEDESVKVDGVKYCKGVIQPHDSIPENTVRLGTGFFFGKRIVFGKHMGIMVTGDL
ncbi:hypothetical protein APHAL10511_007917 [Amanita phalloides]|nr:hypothetical protein APHAL10511_007917 [Amanita phalloides]